MSSPTADDHIVVAADVGQSGTRIAISDRAGCRVLPGRPLQYGEDASDAIGEIVLDALAAESRGPFRFDTFCAGVTGLNGRAPQPDGLLARLQDAARATRVVLADDSVTSYLGALGVVPGAVVAAGTGAVILAADGRGAHAHVDGAGHVIGDAGEDRLRSSPQRRSTSESCGPFPPVLRGGRTASPRSRPSRRSRRR
jgi:N-acetylglucosamine kinase-like BadF-type ATPase